MPTTSTTKKTDKQVKSDIKIMQDYWAKRNAKIRSWYSILTLVDSLSARGLESYVSNEPQTFYNMAHYLLTKGNLSHLIPVQSESALDLDRRAKVNRACEYMWGVIDHDRCLGGNQAFIDEVAFTLLVTGWYSIILAFDQPTGQLKTQIWSPYDVYPRYANGKMIACVHSYRVTVEEAAIKAETNGWKYAPPNLSGEVTLDDYFYTENDILQNMVLIGGTPVTPFVPREELKILIAPVGGFPDRGSLTSNAVQWRELAGRSIFEVNSSVSLAFNKWKTMIAQILRDTAQPVTEEFSASPQASPETLRERGALYHYAPGEQGLVRVPPPAIPMELQSNILEIRRELQKGSFNDAVYGMIEGQSGYALSLLATSSANQILYPFMDAKHFIVGECDSFWLQNLKATGQTFQVLGQFIEELVPDDIPDSVMVRVNSDVATPKDWLERGTIANQIGETLDNTTVIEEIYKLDPQTIKRRKDLQMIMNHPTSLNISMIAGYYKHAEYLRTVGDVKQADLFEKAAAGLEAQLGGLPPGEGLPAKSNQVAAERASGTPTGRIAINPSTAPPEKNGFTPQNLRYLIGKGTVKARTTKDRSKTPTTVQGNIL
jgi:hypothetical protein